MNRNLLIFSVVLIIIGGTIFLILSILWGILIFVVSVMLLGIALVTGNEEETERQPRYAISNEPIDDGHVTWVCPDCNTTNWAEYTKCMKCGRDKPYQKTNDQSLHSSQSWPKEPHAKPVGF